MTALTRPATWTDGDIEVDGVRLHYTRTGVGDQTPLVLAHGLSDSGRCWTRVALQLDDHFDIVMLDARNHGRSDTALASPELLADDIAAAISALGLERAAVVGHSVGAHTAALLACRHPESVSRLVLEDPPWTADREFGSASDDAAVARLDAVRSWLSSFANMTDSEIAEAGRTQHPDWPDAEYPAWIESNRQVRVEAIEGLTAGGWAEIVDRIQCPTLLVHGEADRGGIVTPAVATRICERNERVDAVPIERAGHNIRRENFEDFIQHVGAFLRRT